MKLRAWLERGVIIVAALATIATSRKGWVVEATRLPEDLARAGIYVVEATSEPRVEVVINGNQELPQPLEPVSVWPGTVRFQIVTAIGFSAIKLGEPATVVCEHALGLLQLSPGPVQIVRDPTDLLALAALAFPLSRRADTGRAPSFGAADQPVTGATA